ncbi:MAG: amidohydrolase [Anaerolineales bacterium]|nr:amidohydrolase [Anaerolineales bacterium]
MIPVDFLIQNGLIVTLDERDSIIQNGAVAISGSAIVAVGPSSELTERYTSGDVIDASGHLVMPGLINGHSHLAMTLLRGLVDDLPLEPFLEKVWKAEAHFMRPDSVKVGAQLAMAEMIRGGTTMAVDMYWFPETNIEAARQANFRLVSGPILIGFNGPDGIPSAERMARGRDLIDELRHDDLIVPAVMPHGTYTVSPELLQQAAGLAADFGILLHTHASETKAEVETVTGQYGRTPIQHLDHLGMLSERMILAHCVHPTDRDIEVLASSGASVVHCPYSNLKTAAGISPVPQMRRAGIPIFLGTDGASTSNDLDMWKTMRLAAILPRGINFDPTTNKAADIVDMATRRAARALGQGDRLGSLEAGKQADIILVSLDSSHMTPLYDVYSHLVYAAGREDVTTVLINGRVVMRERNLLTIDEKETKSKAHSLAKMICKETEE